MLDLGDSHKIVIRPGYTDMRLGILGLSALIGKPETGCSYLFCGSKGRTIKVIEFCSGSVLIHTKKSLCGKFVWPTEGSVQNISVETFRLLTETVDEMARLKIDLFLDTASGKYTYDKFKEMIEEKINY